MDIHDILRAWASPLIAAAALGWTVVTGRGKAAQEAQDKLEVRICAVETSVDDAAKASANEMEKVRGRLSAIEQTVQHMPTREQFHAIELSFERMGGDMRVLSGSMNRVEELLKEERRRT